MTDRGFLTREASIPIIWQIFVENCMKENKIGLAPPSDPPMPIPFKNMTIFQLENPENTYAQKAVVESHVTVLVVWIHTVAIYL